MRKHLIFLGIMALLVLFIPFLSLGGSVPEEVFPTESAPSSAISSGAGQADSFLLLDESTGKTFSVSDYEYVLGALSTEMPATFHPEALKAQAVACYTYAYRLRSVKTDPNAPDLTVNTGKYSGYATREANKLRFGDYYDRYYSLLTAAVDEVFGVLAVYDGVPIAAAYHSTSPGKTEDARYIWGNSLPYLQPVESEGDLLSPHCQTTLTLTRQEAAALLTQNAPESVLSQDPREWFDPPEKSPSGTVLKQMIGGVSWTGIQLRELFSLRSAAFDLSADADGITFTVYGYGHGVGLSQYGADFMGRQGSSWQEILCHYYTGIELIRLD